MKGSLINNSEVVYSTENVSTFSHEIKGTKKKILIIDDDPDLIEAMKIPLEVNDYEVISYIKDNGIVDFVVQERPDLIFLDVIFPENPVAGFEICRALKQENRTKSIPVVIVSAINQKLNMAFSTSINENNDVDIPGDDFCEKPLKPDQLLAVTRKFLN